jgi:hypothetical protein
MEVGMEHSEDPTLRLRLLECWLPLAQQFNHDLGWGYAPFDLETLIIDAAPDLAHIDSAVTARAILWRQHLVSTRKHESATWRHQA